MEQFIQQWHNAALTSLSFFWMAFWAFALGYLISSLIQVLVTRQRMRNMMGDTGTKSVGLATFFGFISSSCSFAALSTTRALFQKGAGLIPSVAFLLASTNLVIELGIVIALFLSWQFVVGEYLGGILLIFFCWIFIRLTRPNKLIKHARDRLDKTHDEETDNTTTDWKEKATSLEGWQEIAQKFVMEWQMVWKDVLIGFTVAGVISAFVPDQFFEWLFIGSGGDNAANPGFWSVLSQTLIGPVAAFFTFIGSMGNIPLAALLFGHGVSLAGVMAFIFSDLVVLPVLRINAQYYGWKMALYILLMLLLGLVVVSLSLHYGLLALDMLPEALPGSTDVSQDSFQINYTLFLNLLFMLVCAVLVWMHRKGRSEASLKHSHQDKDSVSLTTRLLNTFVTIALVWLLGGMLVALLL